MYAALKAGQCSSFHPKPEVEGVLGGLGEAAVKGYYKNLGYLALARRCSTARRVQFRLKPAVAFLPSKQVLRSARPDVADEALALKAPLLPAEQWAQPAKSVRRASSSVLGFRLKLVQPTTRRRTLKALQEFSKYDESRRWKQAATQQLSGRLLSAKGTIRWMVYLCSRRMRLIIKCRSPRLSRMLMLVSLSRL